MKKSQEGLKLFIQDSTMQFKDEARVEKVVRRELQLEVQHTLTLLDVPSHLLAKSDFTIYYYLEHRWPSEEQWRKRILL